MALSIGQVNGSNFSYQRFGFEKFLDDVVELNLRRVELWGVAPHLHIPQMEASDIARVRRALQERELSVACFTPEQVAYPVNIASSVRWLRDSSIAMFRRAAEVAGELGSPLMLVTSGWGAEDEPLADAWDRAVEALSEISGFAEGFGVECVIEALQRTESNLVTDSVQLVRMQKEVGGHNLFIALDTVAMAVAGETVTDYGKAFGSIRHVHLTDGRPAGHLAWGDGRLSLTHIIDGLAAMGYSGTMTFEFFGNGSYILDPRRALVRCVEAVKTVLGKSSSEVAAGGLT